MTDSNTDSKADSKTRREPEGAAEHAPSALLPRRYHGLRRQAFAALSGCLLVAAVWGVLAAGYLVCPDGYASVVTIAPDAGAWRTERPLIGIVSQSLGPDALGGKPTGDVGLAGPGKSYIAASYVKFIESAGARVVPILQDMPREEVERRFKAVNGILIPGGSQPLSPGHPYYDTTKLLLDMTIHENDEGTSFPLHGTCLGFEALAVAVAGNYSILQDFDAGDDPRPLIPGFDMGSSEFFGSMPRVLRNALFSKPFAYENHVHGITYGDFVNNPMLTEFFDMLTMSVDKRGKHYISTMEAKRYVDRDRAPRAPHISLPPSLALRARSLARYPVSATQWHPEKNIFEWSPGLSIPHDPVAVLITQAVANAFVNRARKNGHAPASREEENELLIYNWSQNLEFTGRRGGVFDQVYTFAPWERGRVLPRQTSDDVRIPH